MSPLHRVSAHLEFVSAFATSVKGDNVIMAAPRPTSSLGCIKAMQHYVKLMLQPKDKSDHDLKVLILDSETVRCRGRTGNP